MTKLTQIIFDGAIEAATQEVIIYEGGLASGSYFFGYDMAIGCGIIGADWMWNDHLYKRMDGLFGTLYWDEDSRSSYQKGRYNDFKRYNSAKSFHHNDSKPALIVKDPYPFPDLLASIDTDPRREFLNPFPVLNMAMLDKSALYGLCRMTGKTGFLPRQRLYTSTFDPQTQARMQADWSHDDILIIKRPHGANGEDVVLLPRDCIGSLTAEPFRRKAGKQQIHPLCVVQEVIDAKTVKDKQATFRVAVSVWQDEEGGFHWAMEDTYWKLPDQPKGPARTADSTISNSINGGAAMEEGDKDILRQALDKTIMPVLQKLATANAQDMIMRLLTHDDDVMQYLGMLMFFSPVTRSTACFDSNHPLRQQIGETFNRLRPQNDPLIMAVNDMDVGLHTPQAAALRRG